MTTMFNATLQLAQRLGIVRVSTATGGTTSTLLDTKRTEIDDAFNPGGTVWLITDAGGASAAPEGEFPVVTDFAKTGGVITATFTVAPASGDTYGVAGGDFPLDVLISAINNEIIKYKQPLWDLTSLDITNAKSEYDLPTGIRAENLIGVFESTVDDADDGRWVELNWHIREAATGTQHKLVIDTRNVGVDNDIGLQYLSQLSPLYLATDVIDDIVKMARILDSAAAHARVIRMSTYGTASKLEIEMLRIHREDAVLARAENVIRYPARRGSVVEGGITRSARLEPVAQP